MLPSPAGCRTTSLPLACGFAISHVLFARPLCSLIGLAHAVTGPGVTPRYLFPKTTGNRHATRSWEIKDCNRMLRQFSLPLGLRNAVRAATPVSPTHRLRHTKPTTFLNPGAPVHALQPYLAHLSPDRPIRHV